jgi:hypothetical protein
MVLVSGLIVADVLLGSRLLAEQRQVAPPEQLWLVPQAEQADRALLGMRAGPRGGDYTVVVTVAGQVIDDYELDLAPEETWQIVLVLGPEVRAQPVVARLYVGDSRVESRFVVLQPATDGA